MKLGLFCTLLVLLEAAGEQETTPSPIKCDDGKCRSPDIYSGYVCWALGPNDTIAPFTCADGYVAQDLSSVATIDIYKYYTCCLPGCNSPMLEECTDQACASPDGKLGTDCWADGPYEPMTCSGGVYKYPRKTGLKLQHFSWWYSHYVCCKTSDGTPPLQRNLVIAEGFRAALASVAFCCNLLLLLGILVSRKARRQAYNLYLVALAIPDAMFNAIAITVGSKTLSGVQISCQAMHSIGYFYSAANIWLNTIIVRQIFTLLRNSYNRKRTDPPPIHSVIKQTAVVYLFSAALGAWGTLATCAHIPVQEKGGFIIIAMTWIVVALLPFVYLVYICICIWWQKLLPRTGLTRTLSIYFFRVILVFVITWIPNIIVLNLERNSDARGLHYVAWCLGSLQGTVSVGVALKKPGVRNAVIDLLKCRCFRRDDDHDRDDTDRDDTDRDGSDSNLDLSKRWPSNFFKKISFRMSSRSIELVNDTANDKDKEEGSINDNTGEADSGKRVRFMNEKENNWREST